MEKDNKMTTEEIDGVIQPYYQKAQKQYEKEQKKTPWDLYFYIIAILLTLSYLVFD